MMRRCSKLDLEHPNLPIFCTVAHRERNAVIAQTNDSNFHSDVLSSNSVVLVDFYATWCGPCRMLLPILETLAQENPDIKFFTVNVDESIDLSNSYEVRNLPTLLIFKDGEVIARNVGAATKSEVDDLLRSAKI